MTASKHFKQLVRARMRETGERYSVARRHLAGVDPGWEFRGGDDGEAAALANVLANLGVTAPHTREPLTEDMILGVGGGLGAGYILWEFGADHARPRVLTLGFRRQWQYPDRWVRETARRLGVHAEVHETGGVKAAATELDRRLDAGVPVMVWVDHFTLGLHGEPEWLDGYGGPPVVVFERRGDAYAVDDRSGVAHVVPAGRLSAARARVGSYRNRLVAVDPERSEPDLVPAVEEGLRLQVEHLGASSDSFSLPAWRKWARMVDDDRNAKGWRRVFADGRGIGSLRASVYADAAGGRHLRGRYADFLRDAADLLGRTRLRDAADAWGAAARSWEAIVDLALPPGDALRAAIDARDPARWELQRRRDEEVGSLPDLAAVVNAMFDAETEALARLRDALH